MAAQPAEEDRLQAVAPVRAGALHPAPLPQARVAPAVRRGRRRGRPHQRCRGRQRRGREPEFHYLGSSALFGPSNATDGGISGDYAALGHIRHTALEANPWLRADFNGSSIIDSITAYNRTDCRGGRVFSLRWELLRGGNTVFTYDWMGLGTDWISASLSTGPVQAGAVKITLLASSPAGETCLHLGEVQDFSNAAVPEPATCALLAAGLGAIALLRRRR